MVSWENNQPHIFHHAVPVDISPYACGPVAKPGVEILATDKYGKYIAGSCDGDNGVVFLEVKG